MCYNIRLLGFFKNNSWPHATEYDRLQRNETVCMVCVSKNKKINNIPKLTGVLHHQILLFKIQPSYHMFELSYSHDFQFCRNL